jgi:ParB family transcriptional regulator, chromosome partitioning protein
MATEEFLSCLSKAGVERAATAEDVRIGARAKDTRAALIKRFETGVYVHPAALFQLSEAEIAEAQEAASYRYNPEAPDDDESPDWSDGDRDAAKNTLNDNWDETADDSAV